MRRRSAATLLLALLGLVTVLGASPAGADVVGPPLPAAHVGTPLAAPPAPLVGGEPAEMLARRWERCRRYGTLVAADAPSSLWPLDDRGVVARDARGDADGHYAREAHELTADGPLSGEVDFSSRFNGAADAVAVPGAPDTFSGTHPYTVELWVRPQAIDTRYRYLFSRESTTAAGRQGTGVWIQARGIGFERYRDGVSAGITVSAGLSAAVWSHVVATYDGATMRLFVNGVQVGAKPTAMPLLATGTLELGAGAGGGSGFLSGDLDEVALYDRAVTRSHIAAHVAASASAPCHAINGADGASYTPTLADLGHTLQVMTIASRTTPPSGTVASVSESTSATDDAGQFVNPTILTPAAGTVSGTVQLTATVAGLPFDRIEFLVDGVVRYAKEEPPLQYTWYSNAEPNGTHTLAVRVYGPRSSVPVTATRTVTVSNKTVYPAPLPFGRESLYAEFNEGDLATANNLLDNVWPARGFPLPKLGWPLTWTEDPYNDAYWRFYHYGLRPEASLLYEWRATGDRRYLDKLVAILRSFVAYDAVRPVNTLTFDNNHAAAYRAMTLVNYYVKLQQDGELPSDLRAGLEAALARLGAFLAVPSHFEGAYNHGFNEGAALLLIADNFPELPGAGAWRATALARLQGMLDANLDADGVDVENSPFYHVYVLGLVYQIAQWASLYEPALAPSYTQAAQRMLRYAAYVTQPSGYLPMLGATATTYMPAQDPTVYGPMASTDPEFAFAYTRGAQGTPPPDGTYLFPSSGLFVMRSPLGTPSNLAQQTFVTFDAGPYRTEHSDLDALGITMYSNGSTVLPESGLFTYTEQPDRSYFHGTRAHNTVVVDGADQAAGSAIPGVSGDGGGATWARGSSALYPGVTHGRAVVVLRQGLSLVVDRLRGSATHAYTQTWHLPPDAIPTVSGQDVTATSGAGKQILTIRQADPSGQSLATTRGQTTPVMQGWYSSSYGSKVPAWALEYTRRGTSADFTTLLAAGPYAAQPSTVTTTPVSGGTRVDVCVGASTGYAVQVPSADASPITVTGGPCAPAPPAGDPDPARPAYPAPDPLVLSPADEAAFAPLSPRTGEIPVLMFHSLCRVSGCTAYNMTPDEFARTMLMIRRAGLRTISIADYSAFQRGQPVTLPAHPILLTFDDARYDGWRGADAVLAALGERATMFDITGSTDARDTRFLRWDELARVQASGRWDVQVHAGNGHVNIPVGVDASGADVLKPSYAWRAYDPARWPSGDHLEPYEMWKARVEGDIAQADALLRTHVPGYRPLAFAVPFGDYGQFHTNDARIPVELSAYLTAKFGVAFVQPQADPPFSTAGREPWRYTVRSTSTADEIYAWLQRHSSG